MREKARLTRARWEWLAKAPFAVFAVVGFFGIWQLKFLLLDQRLVTTAACLAIVAYCVIVHSIRAFRIRDDHLGDNAYYLGFIYTLSSLSWALIHFNEGSVSDVVSNFGLAIATTVVGIALRVFINQMRRDTVEIEREARLELTDAVGQLRKKLEEAVLSMASFGQQVQQAAAEQVLESATKASEALQTAVSKIASVADQAADQLSQSSTRSINQIDAALTEFRDRTTQLSEPTADTAKALKNLARRLQQIEIPVDAVTSQVGSILTATDQAVKALGEGIQRDRELLSKTATEVERLSGAIAGSTGAWAELFGKLTTSSKEYAEVLAGAKTSAGDLAIEQQRMVAGLQDSLSKTLAAIAGHNDELQRQLDRSRGYVDRTHEALASMTEALEERLR